MARSCHGREHEHGHPAFQAPASLNRDVQRICLCRCHCYLKRCPRRNLRGERRAKTWCERGDSNSHGLPHWILNPARLPIPPLSPRTTAIIPATPGFVRRLPNPLRLRACVEFVPNQVRRETAGLYRDALYPGETHTSSSTSTVTLWAVRPEAPPESVTVSAIMNDPGSVYVCEAATPLA